MQIIRRFKGFYSKLPFEKHIDVVDKEFVINNAYYVKTYY